MIKGLAPVADWRRVLRHAWSVRWLALSWLFGGIELAIPFFYDNPPIPRGLFAACAFAATLLASIFRFISQKEFRE